jgi:pilus assembly protein TadC
MINLTFGALIAAGLAGLAAAGFVGSPARQLRRTAEMARPDPARGSPPWVRPARAPGLRGLMVGRTDAPPLARRVLVSLVAALALVVASSGLGPAVSGLGWVLEAVVVLVLSSGGVVLLGALEPLASHRRRQRSIMDAPVALELLAGALAAGLPPRTATAAVVDALDGPVADDLARVLAAVEVGMSDALAWRGLRGHPALGEAAADLARSVESGTMMVETLAHHARTARRRRQAAVEVAAKAVGVRCVLPMMICFIPAFLLLGIVPTVVSAFLAALPSGIPGYP